MPTDKQAKQAQIGAANLATKYADEKWQLVVDELRVKVHNWEQTAKMLAMDLGRIEYAQEIYDDIASGLYEKVRERLKSGN